MASQRSFAEIVPEDQIEMIGGFPTPPVPKVRPFHALSSVIKLLINKEDTRQVFEVVGALAGASSKHKFRKLVATEFGRRSVSEPIKLEEILGDREELRKLPEGSFGRAYLAFMEGQNLTPDGLTEAADEAGIDYECDTQFEEFRRMYLNLEVSHDLWHVLTGYNRDALGEICLLGFTRAQTCNPGFRLIIWVAAIAQKLEQPSQPIWRAIDQGVEMGKSSEWLMGQDVIALLRLPLEEVRRKLKIIEPTIYNSVPQEIKDNLLKPRVEQTQAQRESGKNAAMAA